MTAPDRPMRIRRPFALAIAIAIALAVAACQPRTDAGNGNETAGTPQPPAPSMTRGAHAVSGTATYLERIKMPPGASLRVQLIDNQLADTPKAVLSDITLKDVAGPPYAFSLPYDPVKLRRGGQYGLHAALSGPDGQLWFVSDTRVPVDPASNRPVEIRLVRVPGPGEATPPAAGQATYWQCGEMRVGATFDNAANTAALSFAGRSLTLPQAMAASGARYADDHGNEFWTKGDSGTLALKGEEKRDCRQADGPSPWDAAKARNVAFRAVGNEPGWLVEVGQGKAPPLHAELDYGSRKIDIAQTTSRPDGLVFSGKTGNGLQVELTIERKLCQADMSGTKFDATAQLSAGGKTYRGCGAFLIQER